VYQPVYGIDLAALCLRGWRSSPSVPRHPTSTGGAEGDTRASSRGSRKRARARKLGFWRA